MANAKKPRTPCLNCGKDPSRTIYQYCSNSCQQEYQYKLYLQSWKSGEKTGLQGHGVVSGYIKRYLREKFSNQCCLCGWSEVNPVTGVSPLVADHIDGNWLNNTEANLRLLCPNCDSLTPTYAGLNRGKGRATRAPNKRALEARVLVGSAGVTQG